MIELKIALMILPIGALLLAIFLTAIPNREVNKPGLKS